MSSFLIRFQWPSLLSFCFLAAFTFLTSPETASAEPTTISGFSFLGNHPTLGNRGMNAPGTAMSDEAPLGPASVDLKFSFLGYATAADTIIVEDTTISFVTGDIIFQLGPATHMPETLGPIPGGAIFADITGASTTIPGLDPSKFIGGEFAFTYQNAQIQPGQSQSGNNGRLVLGSVASASFTFRVPEPSSVAFSLMGLIGLAGVGYRQRRKAAA